jgi:hypothetical protein
MEEMRADASAPPPSFSSRHGNKRHSGCRINYVTGRGGGEEEEEK